MRGITGGIGMIIALPLLIVAVHDFVRRPRFPSFVAAVLASLAAAYWVVTVWRAVTPVAG